jgi:hypothetical protein
MTRKNYKIFASYSRQDEAIVAPLVELIRISGTNVFRDEDNLKPGDRWVIEIASAIKRCQVVLVFWCIHSSASKAVASEYRRGVNLGKRIVPILLDNTAMAEEIGQYQGIDLRSFGPHVQHPRLGFADRPMTQQERELATSRMEQQLRQKMAVFVRDWLKRNITIDT